MNYNEYMSAVGPRLFGGSIVGINQGSALQFYEERTEAKWFATKLKIYSFVSYMPRVSRADIVGFSEGCMAYALQNYSGLVRGAQNGVVSFNVLAGDSCDPEAVELAQARPTKHWAAMEMPVLVDLPRNQVFYYRKTPIFGAIYYSYFRKYIEEKFTIRA